MSEKKGFRDVTDGESGRFSECMLAKRVEKEYSIKESDSSNYDTSIIKEINEVIKNKLDGLAREKEVGKELEKKYPAQEGYQIIPEAYLRDKDGNIVKDSVTGEARRVDFMVVKDGKVIESIEVTSKTADKTEQIAKEERIRDTGGNYIRDNEGKLVKIPTDVRTHIERRD